MNDLDFPYVVYQENILILGMQGTGKTSLANDLLSSEIFHSTPRFIWSPQKPKENYGSFGELIADVDKITDSTATVWVGDFSKKTFDRICNHIMTKCNNMLIVVDDVHEQVTKHNVSLEFSKLFNSGRNRGICCIFLSPYPNLITNQILQACRHRFCFRLDLESQIKWVQNSIYGVDAWLLFPQDLRQKEPTQHKDLENLPDHSYIYRYDGHVRNQLILK